VTLPSIEMRAGADLDKAIASLETLAVNSFGEAQPVGPVVPVDKRLFYVQWAHKTEGELRTFLSMRDAAAFFASPRHRDICSMTPGSHLLPMISDEVGTLADRFRSLAEELKLARTLFQGEAVFLVPDTSFFIEYDKKLEDVDFRIVAQRPQSPVRVLIPIVVVDELDRLKKTNKQNARWRAAHSLAVIDRIIAAPPAPGVFGESPFMSPRGEVTLQIVFDSPGHSRKEINDDEIVDRALACKGLVGDLTLITYDTGQSQRARMAGLDVNKLSKDLGEEPPT
jgi:hypothetical protein